MASLVDQDVGLDVRPSQRDRSVIETVENVPLSDLRGSSPGYECISVL